MVRWLTTLMKYIHSLHFEDKENPDAVSCKEFVMKYSRDQNEVKSALWSC